jgi:hypothetical protein
MSKKAFGLTLSALVIFGGVALSAVSPRWVYGYVYDAETGQALPGVSVSVGEQQAVTDAEGYFQIESTSGLSVVRAAADGYQVASASLAVANLIGTRREISLRLNPNELRGTVTDAVTGAAIAGATVRVGEREAQTDEGGRYTIRRLPAGAEIRAQARFYAEGDPVEYTGQAVQDMALTILPVTVTVCDEVTGEPLVGATVSAAGETVQTGAQGQASFAHLQPQTEVVATLEGYREGHITVDPGDVATLTLRPPIFKGRVSDQEGRPLADAVVLLRVPGRETRVTRTDEEGRYQIPGAVEQGTLLVRKAGYKVEQRPASAEADVDFQLEVFVAKGIYLSLGYLMPGTEAHLQANLDLVDRTELNTVVIDVKSDDGWLAYQPTHGLGKEINATYPNLNDLRQLLEECKRRNIYTIARVVVFKDSVLAEARPEWAVQTGEGEVWRDAIGSAWMDPFREEVWAYNLQVAQDAIEMGFDEVQLDYIRFPSDGDIFDTNYIQVPTRAARVKAITGFCEYMYKGLEPTGGFLSLDIFGLTTSVNLALKHGDLGIGQELPSLAGCCDYLSPMVYPSTYEPGNLGLPDPQRSPYEVVRISVRDARERSGGTLIRPWLQHYSLGGIKFGPEEFRLQRQGAEESGAHGWLYWNARGSYDPLTFDP